MYWQSGLPPAAPSPDLPVEQVKVGSSDSNKDGGTGAGQWHLTGRSVR